MKLHYRKLIFLLFLLYPFAVTAERLLDDFETTAGWRTIASDGVEIDTSLADGVKGSAIRLDFNFVSGSGYCGIEKTFPMELPENYQFTFYLKGMDAPVNNLEFKLQDKNGENVWWRNQRDFNFPDEWTKITIKKRDIEFAWGPTADRALKHSHSLQFIIASATGGSGSILIDQLQFEEKPPPNPNPPPPQASASGSFSKAEDIRFILDDDPRTRWRSKTGPESQEIVLDLQEYREFGGLIIDWDSLDYPRSYQVLVSDSGENWETVYRVNRGKGGRSFINLKNAEARFIKLELLQSSRRNGYAAGGLYIEDYAFSRDPESFFHEIATRQPRGRYPRYLYNEQSYWTVIGVNNDYREALINSDGMVEVDKKHFSIEPFLFSRGKLLGWHKAESDQKLAEGYLPLPQVTRRYNDLQLTIRAFAEGRPDSAFLYLSYSVKNTGNGGRSGNLYLAIRPFQVNPPWQFLNIKGGAAPVTHISFDEAGAQVDEKLIFPLNKPLAFGAAEFDEGGITEYLARDTLPPRREVSDHFHFASAALRYPFHLQPGEEKQFHLLVPFYPENPARPPEFTSPDVFVESRRQAVKDFWREKINTVAFRLPASADKLINTVRSNL
ncbi:MAG: discoidin domain-containing protein, partial [Calditrichia bacterium]